MKRLLALLVLTISLGAMATEEPEYAVVLTDEEFELREYAPKILAEVIVKGDYRRAGNSGFRPLADYIFGNNRPQETLKMTTPVTQVRSTKIAMTAPVTRVANEDESWTVSFVMPSKWTMETLPQPNNEAVTLREAPAELLAAARFSGRASAADYEAHAAKLQRWLSTSGYESMGEPRFAGYNAPWVPGLMRRNEVLIPVRRVADD